MTEVSRLAGPGVGAAGRTARPARAPAASRHAAAGSGRLRRVVLALLFPTLVLLAWEQAVRLHWLPEQILPPPSLVWSSLCELGASGELWSHLSISLSRLLWSLAIGGAAGLLLGLGFGVSPLLRAYLRPSVAVVSQFPVIGWVPLLIIVAGIGEPLKIAAISIAVVPPMAISTEKGIADISRRLLEVGRVHRLTRTQLLRWIILPGALPGIFTGLRQSVLQAWLALVFVELVASSEGIGYVMVWGRQLMQLDFVIVGMLAIGVTGVLLDRALAVAERSLHRRLGGPLSRGTR